SDDGRAVVAHRAEVVGAAGYSALFAAPARVGVAPGRDFIVFAAADRSYGRTIDRPIVLHGRLPDPTRADEIVVNEAAAAAFGLPAGSRTSIMSLGADELENLLGGRYDQLTFHGP